MDKKTEHMLYFSYQQHVTKKNKYSNCSYDDELLNTEST
jgi:hypothetical protein